jgi:LssY C-terminus
VSRARAGALCALVVLAACARGSRPRSLDEVPFRTRQQTQEEAGVRVTTAVPSAEETRELFGQELYRFDVQPVWLEIENRRDDVVTFLPVGLDAEYYSPIEAANLDLGERLADLDRQRNRLFFDQAMPLWVPPGETRSGFVFTRLDEGTKSFNVDVSAGGEYVTLTFFVPVPGLRIDHRQIDWDHVYPADEWIDLDQAQLAAALAAEPCCATDQGGNGTADPLNLVVIGDPEDVYYAFIRAGWDETETIYRASAVRTVLSFLTGGRYRYSPVSSLYVFGRKQDVAFQKARDNIHQRNHLRLWMSNVRLDGKPVWLGQISRDIGVRFTPKTITTHKIDPDVDETREFLLENLAYAQSLRKFGYAGGVGPAPIEAPRRNLTGDPYFTDGQRLVLWVTSTPVDLADVEVVELGAGGGS